MYLRNATSIDKAMHVRGRRRGVIMQFCSRRFHHPHIHVKIERENKRYVDKNSISFTGEKEMCFLFLEACTMKTDKIRASASATTTNAPPTNIIEKDLRLQGMTYFLAPINRYIAIELNWNSMNEISLSNMDGRGIPPDRSSTAFDKQNDYPSVGDVFSRRLYFLPFPGSNC